MTTSGLLFAPPHGLRAAGRGTDAHDDASSRRLCILKGIYPREPTNRKAGPRNRLYYFAKDIKFLMHEPLLQKFRELKVFERRLRRAIGKQEYGTADVIQQNRPAIRLDHLVKERYPTFLEALRDLDDALCLIALFSRLPSSSFVEPEIVERCGRLMNELEHYCIRVHALRKVFVSIKGIYYQAEIMSVPVTWIVPYEFLLTRSRDVDYRIMRTFVDFYMTLLGFVLFRLYHSLNLRYPPRLDGASDSCAAGLSALILEQNPSALSDACAASAPDTNAQNAVRPLRRCGAACRAPHTCAPSTHGP